MALSRGSARSPRSRFTLGLLVLTAVTLLVLDLPGTGPLKPVRNALATVLSPVRSAGDAVFAPISNGWRGAFRYDEVREQNERLRAELDDAQADQAELTRLEVENTELRKQLSVDVPDVTTRTARVVSAPSTSFDQTVEINLGSGDGVKDGMAVVSSLTEGDGGAVLGRIEQTSGGRSRVELLTSPDFTAGVSLLSEERAVLRGQGRGRPLLIDQIATSDVQVGDPVFTSGIEDSAFPRALAIGTVTSVVDSASGETQTLEIEPLVDLASVYVKVVLKDPPA